MTALRSHTFCDRHCGGYGRRRPVRVWVFSAVHEGRRVVSFPLSAMGQYFKAVNEDKKEVVCPWCFHGGAKLWEWAANPYGAVFTLLLRKSSGSGGGDYYGYRTQEIHLDDASTESQGSQLLSAMRSTVAMEGQPISMPGNAIVGRWAGDRVILVGDYDDSGIWDRLHEYRNITRELVEVWNEFIEINDLKLKFNPDCSCQEAH